jgi:hypothetical protein
MFQRLAANTGTVAAESAKRGFLDRKSGLWFP